LFERSYSDFPRNSDVGTPVRAQLLGFSAQLRRRGTCSSTVTRIFRATPASGHLFEHSYSDFPRNYIAG
ncbi:hypothetical protein, partial [Paenibacillus pasadenensis]|uniref:hypothetical protein n=1 Tax=Paenibacillus pasadenensis TaxID=217090 RepID=UPI001C3FCCB8